MASVNRATILGRIGKDPETRQGGNTTILKFTVATSEKYKDKEETEWHDVVLFGKTAENLSFLGKGMMVYVEGRIKTDTWEKDGVKHYRKQIIGDRIQCLTQRGVAQNGQRVQEREPGSDDGDDNMTWG